MSGNDVIRVTVTYGAGNTVTIEAEGNGDAPARVAEVLAAAKDELGIPDGVSVMRNGEPVGLDAPVRSGDRLAAIAPAGRKG